MINTERIDYLTSFIVQSLAVERADLTAAIEFSCTQE